MKKRMTLILIRAVLIYAVIILSISCSSGHLITSDLRTENTVMDTVIPDPRLDSLYRVAKEIFHDEKNNLRTSGEKGENGFINEVMLDFYAMDKLNGWVSTSETKMYRPLMDRLTLCLPTDTASSWIDLTVLIFRNGVPIHDNRLSIHIPNEMWDTFPLKEFYLARFLFEGLSPYENMRYGNGMYFYTVDSLGKAINLSLQDTVMRITTGDYTLSTRYHLEYERWNRKVKIDSVLDEDDIQEGNSHTTKINGKDQFGLVGVTFDYPMFDTDFETLTLNNMNFKRAREEMSGEIPNDSEDNESLESKDVAIRVFWKNKLLWSVTCDELDEIVNGKNSKAHKR